MKTIINNMWKNFLLSIFVPDVFHTSKERMHTRLLEGIEVAKKEWNDAYNYFNEVTDPELIEYATYLIETTRRKYIYLVRKSKELGLNL